MTPEQIAAWEAQPFPRLFQLRIAEAAEGRARIDVRQEAVKLRGVRASINGGMVAAFMESAARLCLDTVLESGERAGPTQELSVSYLSAARGALTAVEARLLRRGGRLAVVDVELSDPEAGTLNARATISLAIEPPRE
ncbi:MAG: PaaI family thioesterase [Chloroflexi bacterium]|nr:MAG: PaaI family thioesterase [Chloroflexota bacterium]